MNVIKLAVFAVCSLLSLSAGAVRGSEPGSEAEIPVCFNYGCRDQLDVRFATAELDGLLAQLRDSSSSTEERQALAEVVGQLYRLAARQTPIGADRGGNLRDEEVDGRMDCIDHATTTTRLLELLAARGGLRFHRVLEPARRTRFIFQHFSAVIEVLAAESEAAPVLADVLLPPTQQVADGLFVHAVADPVLAQQAGRYVIDSWFVDNGEAAVVLPLAEWLEGGGPDVQ
ncbi:MAG: hypothetical protein RBR77_14505 [Thauera sp.]|nr:hypothetical protein [Thauera sp.]